MSERTPPSLMLIDSSADERRLIAATASRAGWMVVSASDQETAVGLLQGPHGREVKTAIVGGWHESDGPQLIAALREVSPELPVIVLSDNESVATAVEAMKAGASDFLVRPVAAERMLDALSANADRRRGAGELAPVSEKLAPSLALEQMVGADPEFRSALAVAAKAARNRLPDPVHRRARNRQGNARPRDPRRQPARQRPADRNRLQVGPRQHHRQPVVRPCQRRVSGRVRGQRRQIGPGRRRHVDPRRGRLTPGRNPAIARPHARHRRGPPGRPQRQPFGRRPRHRHRPAGRSRPTSIQGLAERVGSDRRHSAAIARAERRYSRALASSARRASPRRPE